MKATVARPDLHSALALASAASSQRAALPVLTSIRLEARDGALHLLGCDGELWGAASAPANVEAPGAICVQQKLLSDIINALGPGEVSLELIGTSVTLRHGQSEWKLLAFPADEFPEPPSVEVRSSLRLPFGELVKGIDGVAFACSEDSSRVALTGVLFQYDGDTLTMVATDTHRLAVNRVRRSGIGSPLTAIVPHKTLKAIKMLGLGAEEELTVTFDDIRLSVDLGSSKIVSQLLSGTYPNWERVVPTEFTRSWLVDKEEFVKCVERAMIMARDSANRVKFKGEGETIIVSSRSEDKGETREEVPTVSRNGDLEIAFNGKYLKDALIAMGSIGITAELTEASRPAIIRPTENGDDHFCVVMPMAIG